MSANADRRMSPFRHPGFCPRSATTEADLGSLEAQLEGLLQRLRELR